MCFLVSLIPYTQFYAFILSTGETETIFAVLSAHYIRYLVLNFGNVENLDFSMW
jgi:hypothetical protein